DVTPEPENTKQMYVAFRISDEDGLLPADNPAGRPIVLQIEVPEDSVASMQDASGRKSTKKQIFYRIPATSTVRIFDAEEMLLQSRIPVYQLGKTVSVTF
ncbi:MAG: DUF4831 family protein, partial [Bacteroidales bacterium]|nr:DUF4831 family protein [Bacteroidales bacterium]